MFGGPFSTEWESTLQCLAGVIKLTRQTECYGIANSQEELKHREGKCLYNLNGIQKEWTSHSQWGTRGGTCMPEYQLFAVTAPAVSATQTPNLTRTVIKFHFYHTWWIWVYLLTRQVRILPTYSACIVYEAFLNLGIVCWFISVLIPISRLNSSLRWFH